MLNTSILNGRLVADPELKQTPNNVAVTSFTIAVQRNHAGTGKEKPVDFVDIVAWRSTAEFICKYFKKGSLIIIQGSIQTRNYEDKNGNKRKAVEVVADQVQFCEGKKDNEHSVPSDEDAPPDYSNSNERNLDEPIDQSEMPV